MNGAFLHLATNHIPVVAMPMGALFLIAGLLRRSRDIVQVSLAAFVVVALITIFVDQTGGPAAGVVRQYPGVVRADIHNHAEAADGAFATTEVVGGLALIALWLDRKKSGARGAAAIVLAGAIVSSVWLGWVAHLGGLIRHPEIRLETSGPQGLAAPGAGSQDPSTSVKEERPEQGRAPAGKVPQ